MPGDTTQKPGPGAHSPEIVSCMLNLEQIKQYCRYCKPSYFCMLLLDKNKSNKKYSEEIVWQWLNEKLPATKIDSFIVFSCCLFVSSRVFWILFYFFHEWTELYRWSFIFVGIYLFVQTWLVWIILKMAILYIELKFIIAIKHQFYSCRSNKMVQVYVHPW